LTATARQRTALENDARAGARPAPAAKPPTAPRAAPRAAAPARPPARPAAASQPPASSRPKIEREGSSGVDGASIGRKATFTPGSRGQQRTIAGGIGFDQKAGVGKADVTAQRTAPALGRKREGGSLTDDEVGSNQRRNAIDRAASVQVGRGSFERGGTLGTARRGDANNGATLRGGEATATGSGSVRVGAGTVRADGKVDGRLNVVRAEGVVTRQVAGRELQVRGEAQVGAQASANGSIVFDPRRRDVRIGAGGEAFAGARAGVNGSFEVLPGIKLGGEGEARAGIGAGASLDAGVRRGAFRFKGSVSATLGIGGKLGGSVEIDPSRTVAAVRRASPTVDRTIRAAGQLSDQAVARGRQLAQQTRAGFRNIFTSPQAANAVNAMARFGGF
jgi:hypothetical protein